jgi:hypothetical protein
MIGSKIEIGQIRRWLDPDHPKDAGKLFMIVGPGPQARDGEVKIVDPTWSFIIDGRKDWHFADVIKRDSEVVV